MSKARWLVGCLALLALVPGCNKTGPDVVPVTGKVTRGGEPVPKMFLSFQPDEGRSSWANSDENGNFELEYDSTHKGARVGEHTVVVMYRPASIDEEMKMNKGKFKLHPDLQKIVAKYGPDAKDKLRVTIKPDPEPLELKLD
jgi:hypothetical protein